MGKDHVPAFLDALTAIDADGIAAAADQNPPAS
jgi:hypothetical protein